MPDLTTQPQAVLVSARDSRQQACMVASGALLLTGVLLHHSPNNLAWLLQWHALPAHDVWQTWVWSCLSVGGLGWAAFIIVAAQDRRDGRLLAALFLALLWGAVLTHLPKLLVGSPRPLAVLPAPWLQVVGEPIRGGGSMPSGHALAAGAVAALLCLLHPAHRVQRWWPLWLLLAAAVGWSRIAVAAHWPGDVLAGLGLGIAAALLAVWPRSLLRRWAAAIAHPRGQHAMAVLEVAAALCLLLTRTGYPLGWPMQAALAVLAVASAWQRRAAWRRVA